MLAHAELTYNNNGQPFRTKKEADKQKSVVMSKNAKSDLWLKMNGMGSTVTKVQVVGDDENGYVIREVITTKRDS